MNLVERIDGFHRLGEVLEAYLADPASGNEAPRLSAVVAQASAKNGWFTSQNITYALQSIRPWLKRDVLTDWLQPYSAESHAEGKRIGAILAGNIPLVGFHDFMTILLTGHVAVCKLSSQDPLLIRALADILVSLELRFQSQIEFSEGQLKDLDGVIATGSNNSARYFEHYFGKYPNIIRKNRGSVAVLDGTETAIELENLGKDIFQYFGLGCRSVSKLYVPESYDFDAFFEASCAYSELLDHPKYFNNYHYNKTIYLMNREALLDNNLVVLKEDTGIHSPVGVLFFERYQNKEEVMQELAQKEGEIQCVVSSENVPFGQTQTPLVNDYADGVDTVKFLTGMR